MLIKDIKQKLRDIASHTHELKNSEFDFVKSWIETSKVKQPFLKKYGEITKITVTRKRGKEFEYMFYCGDKGDNWSYKNVEKKWQVGGPKPQQDRLPLALRQLVRPDVQRYKRIHNGFGRHLHHKQAFAKLVKVARLIFEKNYPDYYIEKTDGDDHQPLFIIKNVPQKTLMKIRKAHIKLMLLKNSKFLSEEEHQRLHKEGA
jgi:hypothetical protein